MSFKNYKETGEKYGVGGETNWMNLEEGPNKIRIVSEFEDYGTHFDQKLNKSITCIGKEKGCEYCKSGAKPRVQFKGWVIDRKDKKIKLLTIGYKIYQQIGEFANSDQYGFDGMPNYDITINRNGVGLGTKYNVIPDRKDTLLTTEETNEINQLQLVSEIIENMKSKVSGAEEEINPEEVI